MADVEQVSGPDAELGEAPVWLPELGELWWVDQRAGDVLRLAADGTTQRWHVADRVGFVRPRVGGGIVLALARSFATADAWGDRVEPLGGSLWPEADVFLNDGGCDPSGALWAGSAPADFTGSRCALWRRDAGGATRVIDGVGMSNGLTWSPDGARAYWTDTLTGRVDVFDGGPDAVASRRPFVTIEPGAGHPDGLTVDADGRVWVALWDGGAVRCYEPDGRLAEIVPVPVRQVTACCFGGRDLDELWITTARGGHRDEQAGAAGALFRVRPGVSGLPVLPFAG